MTLSELIYEIGELGVKSIRVESDYRGFVNRAQRRIAQRRNFTFMHAQAQATITSPSTSANLGNNFKCLSSEKSPVSYQDPTNSAAFPIPVNVISRAEANRYGYNPNYSLYPTQPNSYPLRYVFIEKSNDGNWYLILPDQYQVTPTITFTVSAFYYPADLKLGDDRNGLTDHGELCDALVNLTKALAYFAEETDNPKGMAAMQLYEQSYRSASYSDVAQSFAGRALHM